MPYKEKEKQAVYLQQHYQNNKKRYRETNTRNRRRAAARVWEYKSTHPCEICGETHPACLDFHHLKAEEKEKSISRMVECRWSWQRTLKEIEKCRVLCANCHRKLHWELAHPDLIQQRKGEL